MNVNVARDARRNKQRDKRSTHRFVKERIVVTGKLILETPASFGNGDADAFTDMPLLEDEVDGSPLLTGTSLAGALRNYLREYEKGYEGKEGEKEKLLFGHTRDDEGWQSPLIVHDARGKAYEYELRDGVKIDLRTRTAADDFKYDYRLLAAGTTFDLRLELLIGQHDEEGDEAEYREKLVQAFATALNGLAKGAITLGARKRRGFGRCSVKQWEVRRYDLTKREQLLAWLTEDRDEETDRWATPVTPTRSDSIFTALNLDAQSIADERKQVTLTATFSLNGSVMVRSGFGESDKGADMVHLHSFRSETKDGKTELQRRPIIAGTSWAGALRSRATQIGYTLAPHEYGRMQGATRTDRVTELIERIFGPEEIRSQRSGSRRQPARASRLVVNESVITAGQPLRQSRVKIDRFTGGAFESALFEEEPYYGLPQTRLKLELLLRVPGVADNAVSEAEQRKRDAEIGLLLLLLKDLWTGDLAVGGEVSVGRGRLTGHEATLKIKDRTLLHLQRTDNRGLEITGDKDEMQGYVNALKEELNDA